MGLRKKSYNDKLDEELADKFGSDGKSKGKIDDKLGESAMSKPHKSNYPKPEYQSPMIPRLKILFMFMILWIIVIGIIFLLISSIDSLSGGLNLWIIIISLLILFNIAIYFLSDKMVLRAYNAKIIKEKDNPRLYNTVKEISMRADLPMPKVAIIPTSTPNAFATGRNPQNAVVAATEGIMDILDDDELQGVMAHEMAHVKNRDILVMTVASTAAMIIAFAARMIFFQMIFGRRGDMNWPLLVVAMVTAPIAAIMVQYAISRSREYKADRIGSIFIQKPLALAAALEKLEKGNKLRPMRKGDPATSSLFIVNPFSGGGFAALFSTHPPIKERVKRLRKMAEQYAY
jgi:heat shock protein HtpX